MCHPEVLGLYNECPSTVEETADDRTAERVLFLRVGSCKWRTRISRDWAAELKNSAANDIDWPPRDHSTFAHESSPLMAFVQPPRILWL
jgi:hypothetical protein